MKTKASSRPASTPFAIGGVGGGGDPTRNVWDLVAAGALRQDDLRQAQNVLIDERFYNTKEMAELRASHAEEIRHLESDRLDKIRQVDVSNAAATAAQLLAAVQTLASTAQATAETLRNQVAATAAAVASQTERVVNPIIERIALLEKSSYTGAGKAGVADPQMERLMTMVEGVTRVQQTGAGKSAGGQAVWAYILAGIASLVAVATFMRSTPAPVPPTVIYAAPPGTTAPK